MSDTVKLRFRIDVILIRALWTDKNMSRVKLHSFTIDQLNQVKTELRFDYFRYLSGVETQSGDFILLYELLPWAR